MVSSPDSTTSEPRKKCRDCGGWFTYDKLAKDKAYKGGVRALCKVCKAARVRQSNETRRDKTRAACKAWYWANREKSLADSKAWREAHPDQVKANNQKWQRNHRDDQREYKKRRYRNNPLRFKIMRWRRASRKKELPTNYSKDDWLRALEYFDYRCAVCGRPRGLWHTLAADHWIPLTSPDCPGTIPTNIIPLCQGQNGCNNSKGNRHPHEWLVEKLGKKLAIATESRIATYYASLEQDDEP